MKCNSCGFENTKDAKTCEKCGSKLDVKTEVTNSEDKEEKKTAENKFKRSLFGKLKKDLSENDGTTDGKGIKQAKESFAAAVIPICAVVLIAITLFLIIGFIVETTEEIEIEDYYVALYDDKLDVTYFLFKGKLIPGFIYGKCEDPYKDGGISDDGTVVIVRCPRKDKEGSYTLSAVTPSGVRMISDSIDGKTSEFLVSGDGGYVAYSLTSPGVLYIYDVKTNKSEIAISQDVDRFDFTDECKKIVYLTSERTLGVLEISTDKINSLCEKTVEYAVLDDGGRIVYVSEERKLYVYTEWSNSTEEVSENVADICASSDNTTFAYTVMQDGNETDKDGNIIISKSYFRKGQKDIDIGNNINVAAFDGEGENIYVSNRRGGGLYLVTEDENVLIFEGKREHAFSEDLTEVFYAADDGAYIYTSEAQHVRISENKNIVQITEDNGEPERFSDAFYMYYVESDGIKTISVIYVSATLEITQVADGAESFKLSQNQNTLFVEKEASIYIAKRGEPELKEFCEGKLTYGMYYVAKDRDALYIKEANIDDTFSLYWCQAGEKTLISDRVSGESYMSHDGYLFFTEILSPEDDSGSSGSGSSSADSSSEIGEGVFDPKNGKGLPLYCVRNGGDKSHVADNVCMIRTTKASVYIITPAENYKEGENPVYSVYGCVKGNKFKLILGEITIFDEAIDVET